MWDVFISHAHEDKKQLVADLAEKLRKKQLKVWYDDYVLAPGDSLRRSIDDGLTQSRIGIVVLSHHFFSKKWPQKELDGLVAIASSSVPGRRIIPIWHGLTRDEVTSYSPTLADLIALDSSLGAEELAKKIANMLKLMGKVETRWRKALGIINVNEKAELVQNMDSFYAIIEEVLYEQKKGVNIPITIELDTIRLCKEELQNIEDEDILSAKARRTRIACKERLAIAERRCSEMERGINAIINEPAIRDSGYLWSSQQIGNAIYGFLMRYLRRSISQPRTSYPIDLYRTLHPNLFTRVRVDSDVLKGLFGDEWMSMLMIRAFVKIYDFPEQIVVNEMIPAIVEKVMSTESKIGETQKRKELLDLSTWWAGLG